MRPVTPSNLTFDLQSLLPGFIADPTKTDHLSHADRITRSNKVVPSGRTEQVDVSVRPEGWCSGVPFANAEDRRKYIEDDALEVKNLDV